ncbi:MAG: ABC transporter permease [Phycisphaerales bacterium]|nr:ABC transporter permease [Phycisphaerales bacterium]
MNSALIKKTFRDYLLLTLGATVLLMAFMILFMFAINSMPLEEIGKVWLRVDWMRRLIGSLIGSDVLDSVTMQGMVSVAFSHPLMWIIIIAFLLTVTSGVICGEVDRGTMDLLATLPLSRTSLYTSLTFVTLVLGLPVCGAVWIGLWLGRALVGAHEVQMDVMAIVACHLYAAYVFLACFTMAVSAVCSRRTTALTIDFVAIFYSFLLNLLVMFWSAIEKVAFTGFLHYYAPLPIVRDRVWRWGDMTVLILCGLVFWTAGLLVFRRRDVPAR